jgi:uncharacterized alpha-E superfamily protein
MAQTPFTKVLLRIHAKQLETVRNDTHSIVSLLVIRASKPHSLLACESQLKGGVKQTETVRDDEHDTPSLLIVRAPKSHSLHTMVPHAKGWCQATTNYKRRQM